MNIWEIGYFVAILTSKLSNSYGLFYIFSDVLDVDVPGNFR